MVNPTGYTALDLIGFTDQGAYSSSDNYVKNDLVHYSGNIWRCLIDDTTGIAPAEGVNWTLFIGEPTNLVERIIAPVETDPATNAWAVGRQIIFNDNLYEVIAAITAGDALVAYEDDPTNANIKLADPVETQLLDLKGNLSNRNLLDNAWFTVNQRGQSSLNTTGYFMDRWTCVWNPDSATISISNGVVTINGGTTANTNLNQYPESDLVNTIAGKKVTISLLLSDNSIIHKTIVYPIKGASDITWDLTDFFVYVTNPSSGKPTLGLVARPNKTLSLKSVKLELGSVSTLAMDTAPNYQQELAKCQRYFQRIGKINSPSIGFGKTIAVAPAYSTSTVWMPFYLPVPLRTTPTVTRIGRFLVTPSGVNAAVADTDNTLNLDVINFGETDTSLINIGCVDSNDPFTVGELYKLATPASVSPSYLDLSADL